MFSVSHVMNIFPKALFTLTTEYDDIKSDILINIQCSHFLLAKEKVIKINVIVCNNK